MRRSEIRSRFDNGDRIKKTLLATGNYTQYTYDRDRPDLIRAPVSTPVASSTLFYYQDALGTVTELMKEECPEAISIITERSP
mgnify:FL=1